MDIVVGVFPGHGTGKCALARGNASSNEDEPVVVKQPVNLVDGCVRRNVHVDCRIRNVVQNRQFLIQRPPSLASASRRSDRSVHDQADSRPCSTLGLAFSSAEHLRLPVLAGGSPRFPLSTLTRDLPQVYGMTCSALSRPSERTVLETVRRRRRHAFFQERFLIEYS